MLHQTMVYLPTSSTLSSQMYIRPSLSALFYIYIQFATNDSNTEYVTSIDKQSECHRLVFDSFWKSCAIFCFPQTTTTTIKSPVAVLYCSLFVATHPKLDMDTISENGIAYCTSRQLDVRSLVECGIDMRSFSRVNSIITTRLDRNHTIFEHQNSRLVVITRQKHFRSSSVVKWNTRSIFRH